MALNHEEYKSFLRNDNNNDDDDEDYPPNFTSVMNEHEKSTWSHIDDLDQFFTRVYQYHQNHGIYCLIFIELLNLFQIMFLVTFSTYIYKCVDYTKLFKSQEIEIENNKSEAIIKKKTIVDIVYPFDQCLNSFSIWLWLFLIVVILFWIFRMIKAFYNIARYLEIRSFYSTALNIETNDLPNITWHEVQDKLLNVQKKHHLCVHKQELTELDIYNRILRFKNYEVAMINQSVLPPKFNVPIIGEQIVFTSGFKFNLEFLLFWGPFAPFSNYYQLRPEYKIQSKREDLARELSKWIFLLGVLNLILSPVIFIWQLLQFFYNYTELIKRDPSVLGSRKWSNFGKLYFRHFNELDHELEARLSRAYKPASLYVNSFLSKFMVIVAKFIVFAFGAIFAVLVVLTVLDEDVLNVEHVLTIITLSGAIVGIARSLIPDDEQAIYFVEQVMFQILAQLHYMPDNWKNHPQSLNTRNEFVKVFQYKFVYFIEQLLSPITTPILLIFWLKPRALDIVDFFRNFTIDVVGVGDVCSFSQMDTQKHGNPKWLSSTKARGKQQAKNGKTELSLIHFSHTNPQWRMPKESQAFMEKIKEHAQMEATHTNVINQANSNNQSDSLTKSLYHLQSLVYNNSTLPSTLLKSNITPTINVSNMFEASDIQNQKQKIKGGVSKLEGPLFTSKQERQALLTIAQASTLQLSSQALLPLPASNVINAVENSLDMNFSALYMHELHRKYHHGEYIDLDSIHEEGNKIDEKTLNKSLNNNEDDDDDNDDDNDDLNNKSINHRYQTESSYDV